MAGLVDMTQPVDMARVRASDDSSYRRSLPKPSTNRNNITDAILRDTSSTDNLPAWHALTDLPPENFVPEVYHENGYIVAGSKAGRMVLATFGCCLIGAELSMEKSTTPMLMLTPWNDDGEQIEGLAKNFDVVKDWSTIDVFQPDYQAPTLEGTWEKIAGDLDSLYRWYFVSRHGWEDGIFASGTKRNW